MRRLDVPDLWLLLAALAVWAIGRLDPFGLTFGGGWTAPLGVALGAGGLALGHLALRELRRAGTTGRPAGEAARLVTSGPFRRSRNPTYLGMVLAILGLVLWLDAPPGLAVVALLALALDRRHVRPEERRLRLRFREDFDLYAARTRRWL